MSEEYGSDPKDNAAVTGSGQLVIFDLDGTLVRQQSQHLFLSHLRRTGQFGMIPYVKLLFWFVCYRIGLVNNPEKVMKFAFSFLKGRDAETFSRLAEGFADVAIVPAVSEPARKLIQKHHENGDILVLVSNCIEPLVAQVARSLGIQSVIATRLEMHEGVYTGQLQGPAVYGYAKAEAIKNFVCKHDLTLEKSVAYCDHDSDLPLLEIVTIPVAVNPVPELLQVARLSGWQIMNL